MNQVFQLIESEESFFEKNVPHIPAYYNMIKLISTKDKNYFLKLISILTEKNKEIDNLLKSSIYIFLNDYFNSNYRDPLKCDSSRKEKFDIDTAIFKSRKLPFGWPNFPEIPFLNIIRNSLKLKKFKWTKNFLERNSIYFKDKNIQILNYGYALLLFSDRKFDKARKIIDKIEFKHDCNIEQSKRILNIMIRYELGEIEEVIDLIKSDLRWLYRKNNISLSNANSYKINLKYFEKLVKFRDIACTLKSDICINKFLKFKKDVKEMKYFYEKDWMIEKVKELDKQYQLVQKQSNKH